MGSKRYFILLCLLFYTALAANPQVLTNPAPRSGDPIYPPAANPQVLRNPAPRSGDPIYPPQPNYQRAAAPQATQVNYQRPASNGAGISDGHRLITRALWRIFDALMEKKNNEALYGRINVVEGALNNMLSDEAKFKTNMNDMQEKIDNVEDDLGSLKKEVNKVRDVERRVRGLEDWQLKMERQGDDEFTSSSLNMAKPAFSSCPSPFEAVGGECIHVVIEKKLEWRDARRECAKMGGDLASPRDIGLFKSYLRNLPGARRPQYAWIGLSRTDDDVWVWATGNQVGRPADMSQETWNVDLPQGVGDCGGVFELAGYRAYDYKCEEKDNFICQYFF